MKMYPLRETDRVGIQAIYNRGELVYRCQDARTVEKPDHARKIDPAGEKCQGE